MQRSCTMVCGRHRHAPIFRTPLALMRGSKTHFLFLGLSLLSLTSPSQQRPLSNKPAANSKSLIVDTLIKPFEAKFEELEFITEPLREPGSLHLSPSTPLHDPPLPPAVLSDLQVVGFKLVPRFNATVFEYSASVPEDTSAFKIIAFMAPDMEDNVIMLNTGSLTSGKESPAQAIGENGETVRFTVSVWAAKTRRSQYTLTVYRGKKLSILWRIVKWSLYILGGLVALGALVFGLYSIYACCKGSRLLAESGHTLGWWPFGYFAHGQQARVSGVAPDSTTLLAGPGTARP